MDSDAAFEKFRECAVEVLQVPADKITKEAKFAEDLDADSLDLVELVMALEEAFDITVEETELEDITTVGQAYDLISSKTLMQLGIGAEGPIRGRRVAVTGLGAVTCCGVGVEALWDGLLNPSVVGGVVRDYEPADWFGPKEVRQLDRFAQLSMVSADMAVQSAGDLALDPGKAGVIFATGVGGFETLADQVGVYNAKGPDRVSPRLVPMMMANAGAAGISMRMGCARCLRGHLHLVRGRDACHFRCGPPDCVRSLRRGDRWRIGGEHAPGCGCCVLQHDRSFDNGSLSSL